MIVYEKYGYGLKLLEKEDAKEIFQYLSKYKIKNNIEDPEERFEKRDALKRQIIEALDGNIHVPVGIYYDFKLIGVCFSQLREENNRVAKITYIKIDEEHHKTKAPLVLLYFLISEIYLEERIIFSNNMLNNFDVDVRKYPKILNISTLSDEFIEKIISEFEEE